MSGPSDSDVPMDDDNMASTLPQEKTLIGVADLNSAFVWQHQQLEKLVQGELNRRFPPGPTTGTASSSSRQVTTGNFWSLLSPSEHRSSLKDENTIEKLLQKNNELRRENEGLHSLLRQLQHENSSFSADYSSLQGDHNKTRRELAQERLKRTELETKTADLRSMLIPANEAQLSDCEVIAKFASLRNQILKLVKTAWTHNIKKAQLSQEQYSVLKPFAEGNINMRYLDNRLRGVVFSILHDQIFSGRHYPLHQKHIRFGHILDEVEEYMCKKLPNEAHTSIVDWRLATMKATLAMRSDGHSLACAAYNAIETFFAIFEQRNDKKAEGSQLLEKICTDAVALSLMMRTVKDDYYVDMLARAVGDPITAWDSTAEDEFNQPAILKGEKPDTIAYFITGALAKVPYDNPEDVKVLEKAQAVVFTGNDKKV